MCSIVLLCGCGGCTGTAAGDVWEVDQDPRILLHGQPGQPSHCATNPRYPHVFATVASGGKVVVWNAATHAVSHHAL